MTRAMLNNDFTAFEKAMRSLFASIPYNNFVNNPMHEREGYYVSVFYAYMKAMGVETIGEDVTNKGRIDLTLKLPHALYIMEFKTDGKDALAQIKERKYYEKYLSLNFPIYLVGTEFDTKEKNVAALEWEKV